MTAPGLHHLVSRLFAGSPARSTGVGIEQELLVHDPAGATVPVPRLRAALAATAVAPCVAFEPGGQVELSLPPEVGPAAATRALHGAVAEVRAALEQIGVAVAPDAVDDRASVPLRLRSPRYLRMQHHLDTVGPAGRRMMRRTASTQVCLDWWPGRAGGEQWRALQLAAPYLAAAFARSTGPTSRLATWLAVDPDRTAFDGRLLHGDDPVAAYVAFAAGATCFVDGGPAAHLTTLFPPVRPRGHYLEVRFLDAQAATTVDRAVAAVAAVAHDDDLRRRVLGRLGPGADALADTWARAAAGDPEVVAVGLELVRDGAIGVAA